MAASSLSNEESVVLQQEAIARLGAREWAEARGLYERLLAEEETAEALEGLALASWWTDDVDAAIQARERAFVLRREAGETVEAARDAGFLAWDYGATRGVSAVANGWLQRARTLIAGLEPAAEQAWLPLIEASFHLDGDQDAVLRLASEAAHRAHDLGGLDIEMTARTLQGLALVSMGRVDEGTPLLDEGAAAAISGELHDPIAIGSCCCNMIIACERARDFQRVGEWCEQLAGFCDRTGQRPLLAICRGHHGTVLTIRGEWDEAEQELEWAGRELAELRPPLAGYAKVRLAELRRRQGRATPAARLLAEANGHPQASLVRALLLMDDNDPVAAAGLAEKYIRGLEGEGRVEAAGALEVLIPARLSLGETGAAERAYERLAEVASAVGTDSIRASERGAAGRMAMARGQADAAMAAFEDAIDHHERGPEPFEAAQARTLLAIVLASAGRDREAAAMATEAHATLLGLGAQRAAVAAEKLIGRLGGRSGAKDRAGLTRRELEVLSLVAEGLTNPGIAERLVLSEHTVHRHLANVYAKLGVSSRAAAVAGAAERGLIGPLPH